MCTLYKYSSLKICGVTINNWLVVVYDLPFSTFAAETTTAAAVVDVVFYSVAAVLSHFKINYVSGEWWVACSLFGVPLSFLSIIIFMCSFHCNIERSYSRNTSILLRFSCIYLCFSGKKCTSASVTDIIFLLSIPDSININRIRLMA